MREVADTEAVSHVRETIAAVAVVTSMSCASETAGVAGVASGVFENAATVVVGGVVVEVAVIGANVFGGTFRAVL